MPEFNSLLIAENMETFKPGDYVKIIGQDTVGQVISVKGNDLEVAVGLLKFNVKKTKVELSEPDDTDETEDFEFDAADSGIDTKEKLLNFKYELDVRGKMKDEVITELTSWVDDALLLGITEARIIHGRGSGVLKDTVRSFLRKYKEVGSVGDDMKEKGGDYNTLVKFKS
jgi:DNA mismatch repair protein MutS2